MVRQGKGAMDVRMFTILVHAAATAGKRELALSTYRRALRTGLPSSVYLFTAAIGACSTPGQPSDIDTALKIYNDMLRWGSWHPLPACIMTAQAVFLWSAIPWNQ